MAPVMHISTGRRAVVWATVSLLAALCVAIPSASATPLEQKRAEAARIADQVAALDHEYDELQERFRGAEIRYNDLDGRVQGLSRDLEQTQRNLTTSEHRLVDRVLSVYRSGAANNRLVNLAAAGSVSSFVDRMDAIQRVSGQDAEILAEIKRLRARIVTKRGQLKRARAEQQQVVVERKAARNEMGKRLSKRRQVLSSVNAEVRQMVEAEQERRRQAEAAAAARSRDAVRAAAPTTTGGTDPSSALNPGPAAPPPGAGASGALGAAASQVGVKYTWGGSSPSTGFDCSGLVMWAYAQVGISLPHSTYAMWGMGTHVSRDQLAPGDLVFFSGLGHMGIYAGGGSFVHAPHTGSFVKYDSLSGYYDSNYVGAVRVA